MSQNAKKPKVPSIIVDGKTYKAKKKLKLLRKMFELQDNELETESIEGIEVLYQFVADCFGNENVTMDAIEDNLDIDEFFSLFQEIVVWMKTSMAGKLESMPKNVPGASQK